jgi:hypothetical protein
LDYSGLGKEDLLRELQRLSKAVEYLQAENAALVRVRNIPLIIFLFLLFVNCYSFFKI